MAEPYGGIPLCLNTGLKNSHLRRTLEILLSALIPLPFWGLKDVSLWKKKPEMHEMEMKIEKAVFKNLLRDFGTKTHMNNISKILQEKVTMTSQLSDLSCF